MIFRFGNSKGYIKTCVPISYTTSLSDALSIEIDITDLDETEVVIYIVENLLSLYKETGSLDWTVFAFRDLGASHIATLAVNTMAVHLTTTASTALAEVGALRAISGIITSYIPDIVARGGTAASVASATSDDSATPKSICDDDKMLEQLIEDITSKTKADISKPKETLADYVCNSVLREELEEIRDFFENEQVYKDAGIVTPKGVLFKGPPGTGKTYAARCLAGTTECYFMSCTASALQGQFIGSGAENIRAVFKGAKLLREKTGKGVYLFIDELDSFGNRETRSGHAGGEEDRTLNQLLAEMSGFTDCEGVMVLGATNYSDRLDDALTRSGRFSRQITIDKPDFTERVAMIEYYTRKIKIPLGDTSCDDIALITKGLTPADIKEIVNEAAILTLRQKLSEIPLDNVNEAVNKVITKNIRRPDGKLDTQLVAAHEAGHVLAEVLYADSVPVKVTNYSYGSAGGFTQSGSHLEGINDKERHLAEIKMLLGGRAAEEAMFNRITNGASNDLERAKAHLKRYYSTYHFEKYTVKDLEQIILDRLNELYTEVVADFNADEHKEVLTALTDSIVTNRVLYSSDIAGICSKLLLKGGVI